MAERVNREQPPARGPGGSVHATDEGAARPPFGAAVARLGGGDARRRPASAHSQKFRLVTALLAAVAAAALVLAGVLLAGGRSHTSTAVWSSWSPAAGGRLGATEIAEHVAPLYRASAADQLDLVTLMDVANPNAATSGGSGSALNVAIDQGGGSGLSLLTGHTVAYNVCGLGGSGCQLGGTASTNRLLLLRREALELALYTFRYVSGTDNVVVVLPPGHTQTTSTLSPTLPSPGVGAASVRPITMAVLFVRQELQPWLSQPLADTLQEFPPTLSQLTLWKQTAEAGLVDQITARGLFSEKIEQAQDGSNLLVLNQLPPQ